MDTRPGARTILCMIGCARSWEPEGAQLLAVIVTLLGEQLIEVWSVGLLGSSPANDAKGLLLCVTR